MKACLNLAKVNLALGVRNHVLGSKDPVLTLPTMLTSIAILLLPTLSMLASLVGIHLLAKGQLLVLRIEVSGKII